MNELVKIIKDDVFTDSWIIATETGNSHRSVIKMIEIYSDYFGKLGKLSRHLKWSDNLRKSEIEAYNLNEPQATFLITLLKNTETVVAFKLELVKQFYQMRTFLQQLQSPVWKDTRAYAKEIRKQEAEAIKELVEYAISNGSTHAKTYYTSLSTLADKAAGIQRGKRDQSSIAQLNILSLVERIIAACIHEGVSQGISYKDIYKACKERAEDFQAVIASTGSRAAN